MFKEANYLDFIPRISAKLQWRALADGLVQISKPRDSILDRLVRSLFFTPDKFIIDLDKMGSFIWKNIDGKNTVYDLAQLVEDKFGDEAQPLYRRLIEYMRILENNGFIDYL